MPCVAARTCGDIGGSGVVVLDPQSSLKLLHFSIAGSALCAVELATGGVADFADGEVRGNGIGACVETDGFDLNRLAAGVVCEGNAQKVSSEAVPVPSVSLPRR